MVFIFTFLLIAALEPASGNDNPEPSPVEEVETPEEPEICVGCDDEEKEEPPPPQLTVEIRIDPVTGEVQYIIKGLAIE